VSRPPLSPRLPLAAIVAGALALRLATLLELCRGPFSPSFFLPIDGFEYHGWAVAWLAGTWPPPEALSRPPLYPVFLGAVYALVGPHPITALVVQALLGAAVCALAYGIARDLFPDASVALLAAALCAVTGTLVYFDAQLLSASLDVFLSTLALWLLLRAGRRGGLAAWAAAGAALGLAIANRGAVLLWIPLVLLWMHAAGPPAASLARARRPGRLGASAALLLPIAAILAPIALHNARWDEGSERPVPARELPARLASGRFVLLATNTGINLTLGNLPELRDVNRIDHPDHMAVYDRIRTEPERNGVASFSAANAFLVRATLRYVAAHPAAWLGLLATKVGELLRGAEIPRNANLYADREDSWVLSALLWNHGLAVPAGVLIPFGLVGIALARRDPRRHLLVLGALALQGVFVVAFFVTDRYRLPMLPLFAIYAAAALVEIARRARAGGVRAAAGPAGVAALLLVLCNLGNGPMNAARGYSEYNDLAVALVERGDLPGAEAAWQHALAHNSRHVGSLVGLCKVRLDQSRAAEALEPCRNAAALAPESAVAHQELGLALEALGRRDEAVAAFRRALWLAPGAATPERALRRLLVNSGDSAAAPEPAQVP